MRASTRSQVVEIQGKPSARELLLKNISDQMNLQFRAERRPVEVWFAGTEGAV